MKKKLNFFIVFLLLIGFNTGFSQSSVNASGGDISGTGGSLSYSVGQTSYKQYSSSNEYLIEGVQQPFEISIVNAIEDLAFLEDVHIYPNPTNGELNVDIPDELTSSDFTIVDINGVNVHSGNLKSKSTTISVSELASSVYFLSIMDSKKVLSTYKIIKN